MGTDFKSVPIPSVDKKKGMAGLIRPSPFSYEGY